MKNFRILIWALSLILSSPSFSLPIGFGRNQGDLEFNEIMSPHYAIYFDKRTPQEGQAISNALEAARPTFENWFKIKRTSILPVIISSTTSNASFANFITDALELQTMGRGGRDLAWHEMTHNIMYRHLDNFFGPVGNIIHLPWLPAWWLEGLAEATSNSIGSDQIYSIERHTALTRTWPKYDKLHSLYSGSFSLTGYALSGAFVSYILRTYGADKLPQVMSDFFDYTLPWWWPWTLVPFNDFMPMDAALVKLTGKTGEQLYEEYKLAAEKAWRSNNQGPLLSTIQKKQRERIKPRVRPHKAGSGVRTYSTSSLQARNNQLYDVTYYTDLDKTYEVRLDFLSDLKTKKELVNELPDDILSTRVTYGRLEVFIRREQDDNRESINTISIRQGENIRERFKRLGYIQRLFKSKKHLYWLEANREHSRLCYLPLQALESSSLIQQSQIRCPIATRFPTLLQFLGEKFSGSAAHTHISEIWLTQTTETLFGDNYKILRFNTDTNRLTTVSHSLGGRPISMMYHKKSHYLLLGDRTSQFLRKIDEQGKCKAEFDVGSHLIYGLGSANQVYLVAMEGQYRTTYKVQIDSLRRQKCRKVDEPRSPLLYAMHHRGASFQQALSQNHPWKNFAASKTSAMKSTKEKSKPLHKYPKAAFKKSEAKWRGRPVFAFPWIGADAKGYQLGAISVPLMDHLQNETFTFSALYGVASQYPNLQLDFVTNRYKTTYGFSLFRRQLWNGTPLGISYYFDQRGVEFKANKLFHGPKISLTGTITASDRLPYGGRDDVWELLAHGYATEVSLALLQRFTIGLNSLSYSITGLVAPEEINDNFKYDKLSLGLNFNVPLEILGMSTSQSYGLTYGRTRGKRRPFLREVYRPLKTFVPGTGGGFNEINVGLLGPGFLTSAKYGDTQSRFKWAWTFPLVRHLETLIHIFYLERLDFTAFFNYGYAWNQNIDPHPSDFIKAHGYNLDLQSDIKGVTVNLGIGAGQVFDQDWEAYFLFGFDALINP